MNTAISLRQARKGSAAKGQLLSSGVQLKRGEDAAFQGKIAPARLVPERLVEQIRAEAGARAEGAEGAEAKDLRQITTAHLGRARNEAGAALAEAFTEHPWAARDLIRAQSDLTDALVTVAFEAARDLIHPPPEDAPSEPFCVLAVGGYGRVEMAPHSDVDLLFMGLSEITPRMERIVEEVLYILWDLKLKVGHATRTLRECLKLAREDITIRTALLEHRHITGESAVSERLAGRLWSDLFRGSGGAFIEAKLHERSERHARQGGQRYMLEPNVKEGKGGLRDLQTLYWIGKYLHRAELAQDLVGLGLLSQDEYESFRTAEDFLWTVRCHLHYETGRATEKLTFDLQIAVAQRMGYEDARGRPAVEVFMQDYFRQATRVGDLTRIFLTELEARHAKPLPKLLGFFKSRKRLRPAFRLEGDRVDLASPELLTQDKMNLLRLFEEGLRTGYLLHPNAMRLVSAHLHLIDDAMRTAPEAIQIFMDLLLKHGNPERGLRRMNELGVLGAFIPEFRPIVAMMQFNLYHHYTVDEHTIQCVSVLAQIERGELVEELPVASEILRKGKINRKVLYVALLLHDIGKGRPEDHSILGAKIARRAASRLGLSGDEVKMVVWLVRHHLVMSDVAQKRDLSDPRTLRDFAKVVKDQEHLELLTVLTVCDIRGVGPDVWNNWKAVLLRQLYGETADALENGLESLNREKREDEAQRALSAALAPSWPGDELQTELARHYPPYWQGLNTQSQIVFANLLRGLGDGEIRIDLTPEPERDATCAAFAMSDHPGVFSRLSGALALIGANVVDARTYTTKDGYATAVFWIQDGEGKPYAEARLSRLRDMITKILKGKIVAREALKERDKVKKRESAFRFPTHITVDNEGSEIYTILEVDTRDRPGLLFDLTRTLSDNHIYIAHAVIATYGAQVVDTFYVKDMFGLKIHSKSKQEALEHKLRQAITEGAKRAEQ